jgi:hypothetical protein
MSVAGLVDDRVREAATAAGTGPFALGGAAPGFRTFAAAAGVGGVRCYCAVAVDASGLASGPWEVGVGTVGAGTLSRDRVLSSSAGGAPAGFPPGAVDLFVTAPAELLNVGAAGGYQFAFGFGDATPRPLFALPAGKVVRSVEVVILTGFDGAGAALRVGDAADPGRLLDGWQCDPVTPGTYEARPGLALPADAQVLLTIAPGAGPTRGSGLLTVVVEG